MTAALKMAAPGEVCEHAKKLMAFCTASAKSLKAMRQHIGVTHDRMDELMRSMLADRLIWRQSNGMYKTCTNKLQFIDEQPQAANSLLALADDTEQAKYAADLGEQWDAACTVADGELAAADANALEQIACEQIDSAEPDQADITELDVEVAEEWPITLGYETAAIASEFAPKPYNLDAMASEFEAEQERGDQHTIDNLDAKQRALNYCQMLLSPKSTELLRCLDELQMDLAVIRLQQERA